MITTQSTPPGDNPFYGYQMRARAYGRKFEQLAMIIHHLRTEPDRKISVIYIDKQSCENFIKFAEANHVKFETGEIEPWGPSAVRQDIISFEVIGLEQRDAKN